MVIAKTRQFSPARKKMWFSPSHILITQMRTMDLCHQGLGNAYNFIIFSGENLF
jgi:hypothetical protein